MASRMRRAVEEAGAGRGCSLVGRGAGLSWDRGGRGGWETLGQCFSPGPFRLPRAIPSAQGHRHFSFVTAWDGVLPASRGGDLPSISVCSSLLKIVGKSEWANTYSLFRRVADMY